MDIKLGKIPIELYQEIIKLIPLVSSDIVVLKDTWILLLKRNTEPLKDYWALPGGRIYLGETPKVTAVRKLEEEVGIKIKEKDLKGEKVVTYFHPGRQNVSITYLLEQRDVDIKLDKDHSEYRWAKLDNLPKPIWGTTIEQINWALDRRLRI